VIALPYWHLYLAWASSRESEGLAAMLDLHAPPAIDAALPSAMPVPLTAELLADMHGAGFSHGQPSSLRPL